MDKVNAYLVFAILEGVLEDDNLDADEKMMWIIRLGKMIVYKALQLVSKETGESIAKCFEKTIEVDKAELEAAWQALVEMSQNYEEEERVLN